MRRAFHAHNKTKTAVPDLVYDYDGNGYSSVTLCNRKWLTEPIKTTHYMNGDEIDLWRVLPDANDTGRIDLGRDEDTLQYPPYYNYLASTDIRGLLPDGWRMPTYQDFLEMFACRYPLLSNPILSWDDGFPGEDLGLLQVAHEIGDPISSNYIYVQTTLGNNSHFTASSDNLDYYPQCVFDIMSDRLEPLPHPRWDNLGVVPTNSSKLGFLPKGYFAWNSPDGEYSDTGQLGYFWLDGGGLVIIALGLSDSAFINIYTPDAEDIETLRNLNHDCAYIQLVKDI